MFTIIGALLVGGFLSAVLIGSAVVLSYRDDAEQIEGRIWFCFLAGAAMFLLTIGGKLYLLPF